jgi:hypothetical protein
MAAVLVGSTVSITFCRPSMLKAQSRVRRVASVPSPVPRRWPRAIPKIERLRRQSIAMRLVVPTAAPSERS